MSNAHPSVFYKKLEVGEESTLHEFGNSEADIKLAKMESLIIDVNLPGKSSDLPLTAAQGSVN